MRISHHALWLTALLFTVACHSEENGPAPTPRIEGTWRWTFTMPDGSVIKPKLKLISTNGALEGFSSFQDGSETALTNLILKGDSIRFQVIRERDARPITTTYSGKWSENTIVGQIESNWAGDPRTYEWKAQRAEGATGLWKWKVTFGGREIEMRADLKQHGTKLEGTLPTRGRGGRSGQPSKIQKGSIKEDGELYFEVESGSAENRRMTKYKGKLNGDSIKGAIESSFGGNSRESEWIAQRSN